MLINEELKEFLNKIPSDDYFAYVGLTTKIENPFRDKFAHYLHRKYINEFVIAREYSNDDIKRVDLAVLDKKSKEILDSIEFKACYAFDIAKSGKIQYKKEIKKDYKKHELSLNYQLWFVLLSIRINNNTDSIYDNVIKYQKSQNRFLYKIPKSCDQFDIEVDNIKKWFDNNPNIKLEYYDNKNIGKSFETEVYLDYFVFKRIS
jgi:hypothetical protein